MPPGHAAHDDTGATHHPLQCLKSPGLTPWLPWWSEERAVSRKVRWRFTDCCETQVCTQPQALPSGTGTLKSKRFKNVRDIVVFFPASSVLVGGASTTCCGGARQIGNGAGSSRGTQATARQNRNLRHLPHSTPTYTLACVQALCSLCARRLVPQRALRNSHGWARHRLPAPAAEALSQVRR